MIAQLTDPEIVRLAKILLETYDPTVLLATFLMALARPKQRQAIILGMLQGKTTDDKVRWAMRKSAPAFDSEARMLGVANDLVAMIKSTPAPPPPSALTGKESGFLWKPLGENSRKLRVLLPPEYTGHVDLSSCTLWNGGQQIEKLTPIGSGNPLPGRGAREHFAGKKPGGAYPAEIKVRCIADGISWVWSIGDPRVRNEHTRAARVKD